MAKMQIMYNEAFKAHFYRIWYVSETKSTYAVIINPTSHQTITVTCDGKDYTTSFTAKANSTFTAKITPETGYTAGTLNITSGTITSDVSITATEATMNS